MIVQLGNGEYTYMIVQTNYTVLLVQGCLRIITHRKYMIKLYCLTGTGLSKNHNT